MAVNFCEGSTQGAILVNIQSQQQAGTDVMLLDSNGKELIVHTIEKGYDSVVVSCPEIVDGGTYTLKIGTEETQITMDGLIYGSGHEMGGGRGNMKTGAEGKTEKCRRMEKCHQMEKNRTQKCRMKKILAERNQIVKILTVKDQTGIIQKTQ